MCIRALLSTKKNVSRTFSSSRSSSTCVVGFCRSSQFPTEYPSGLAGVIDPYEFRQSIQNINRARRKPFGHKIISCVFLLCLVIGVAVTIAGLVLINNTSIAVWITLTAIGIVVSVLSLILSGCLMINPLSSPGDRLSSAVYAESLKYITRRPIASRWQLSLDWMTAGNSQFGYLGNGYGLTYTVSI